jgi:hypothetical protein
MLSLMIFVKSDRGLHWANPSNTTIPGVVFGRMAVSRHQCRPVTTRTVARLLANVRKRPVWAQSALAAGANGAALVLPFVMPVRSRIGAVFRRSSLSVAPVSPGSPSIAEP